MKPILSVFVLLFTAMLCDAQTNPAFETMKSLAGEWKGTGPEGTPVAITYEVVSGGTAVLETLANPPMLTTYYLDGENLMLTHYCMANNQPRMKAGTQQGKTIEFRFVDATNLKSAEAGHMQDMVLTVEDANNIQQQWTWSEKGKTSTHSFKLERVK
jgi:hypothetical protein